ncbi:MAG: thiamine-phosphate kinase [Alphaproteobacteria bacterium]|nr:thiamine-phosphate kinase [Alphaproteobacteria bacterium]
MAAPRLGEFARIARYFAPLAGPGALGLLDDAALIDPPPGRQLVLTTDAMVAGVHFLSEDPAELIARKLLRVNLSDLAAMGAEPVGYLMTTALPQACDEAWLEDFAAGLAADQKEFGIALLGGDSVATPGPMTLSLTAIGSVAPGRAIRRGGAQPGDGIYVSGTIGDAALGLRVLRGDLATLAAEARRFLADRYHLPRPRLALGARLAGIAHAMLDVSDGLAGDVGHICEVSGLKAIVEADLVPLSSAARQALQGDPVLLALVLAGGDDYELVFAAPRALDAEIAALAQALDLPITRIGRFETGEGVRVLDGSGKDIDLASPGYRHF